jgi:hypothetical protein
VGSFATSVNDYYATQRLLAIQLMEGYAFQPPNRPLTMGSLISGALNRYIADFPTLTVTTKGYLYFGDPDSPLAVNARNAELDDWHLLLD